LKPRRCWVWELLIQEGPGLVCSSRYNPDEEQVEGRQMVSAAVGCCCCWGAGYCGGLFVCLCVGTVRWQREWVGACGNSNSIYGQYWPAISMPASKLAHPNIYNGTPQN
jgi:hypothetical protein